MEIKSYFKSFLEILYPEKNICLICDAYNKEIKNKYICSSCEKGLNLLKGHLCSKCSKPILDNHSTLCNECNKTKRYFQTVKSSLIYEGLTKKIIHDFKYNNKPYYYKLFGHMLSYYIIENNYIDFDLIIPVPIHKTKLKSRGYNQSQLLASYISKKVNIKNSNCLKRIKKTTVQNKLDKNQRKKNVKDAFMVNNTKIIKNKNVLIIDDIYTTGSTINECSKNLILFGAKSVSGLTIARG